MRVVLLLLLSAPVALTQLRIPDPVQILVSDPIEWHRESPIQPAVKQYADAYLVVFESSGRFARISCTLYRTRDSESYSIVYPEGYTIESGEWGTQEDGTLGVTSRRIYANARLREPDTALDHTAWHLVSSTPAGTLRRLRSGLIQYEAAAGLNEPERLLDVIAFHRGEGQTGRP